MTTLYRAKEHQETEIPITALMREGRLDIFPEVQNKTFFDVRFAKTHLTITAGKYIGYVPLNRDTVLVVEPKFSITNMLYLLERSGHPVRTMRDHRRMYGEHELPPLILLDELGEALLGDLREIQRAGLLKRYAERSELGQTPRGAILFDVSLRRLWSRGQTHRAIYVFHEQSADIEENRLLRYAITYILANLIRQGGDSKVIAGLGAMDELFALGDVSLVAMPRSLTARGDDRRAEYRNAMLLAEMLLRGRGIDLRSIEGELLLPSFLVDMETAFEKFLLASLQDKVGGEFHVLDGNVEGAKSLFDDVVEPKANPDFVVMDATGWRLVIDAKYKFKTERDDVNQLLAYALSYRVPCALIVRPASSPSERGRALRGTVQGIRLVEYCLDLSATDLVAEEEALAVEVVSMAHGL